MSIRNPNWTREELILAFNLYLKIPYGTITGGNPQVIELGELLGRSANAVGLKLCNFARFDPYHQARGVKGLINGGKLDGIIYHEFTNNWSDLLFESEKILANYQNTTIEEKYTDLFGNIINKKGETKRREVKTRINQNLFRKILLSIYGGKCAITGIDVSELLVASHILPWAKNENDRLNPENGLLLSSLYDSAFEEGYIGINHDYKIALSSELKKRKKLHFYENHFGRFEGKEIHMPDRFQPNKQFLERHFNTVFRKRNN